MVRNGVAFDLTARSLSLIHIFYAKAFRRGDGFYPQNAIFQDLVLLCIVWQGIDWLREKKFAKGDVYKRQHQDVP